MALEDFLNNYEFKEVGTLDQVKDHALNTFVSRKRRSLEKKANDITVYQKEKSTPSETNREYLLIDSDENSALLVYTYSAAGNKNSAKKRRQRRGEALNKAYSSLRDSCKYDAKKILFCIDENHKKKREKRPEKTYSSNWLKQQSPDYGYWSDMARRYDEFADMKRDANVWLKNDALVFKDLPAGKEEIPYVAVNQHRSNVLIYFFTYRGFPPKKIIDKAISANNGTKVSVFKIAKQGPEYRKIKLR